jgi:hypothetical protein
MWESSNQTFCSDESASNIVMRRSEDSGKTWGEPVVVIGSDEGVGDGEHAERHTWSIFDSVNEKVFLFTNRNVNGPTGCDCGVAYKTSADGGDTWGDLIDLDEGDVYGMGLAHGILHSTGRMVGCMRVSREGAGKEVDMGKRYCTNKLTLGFAVTSSLCHLSEDLQEFVPPRLRFTVFLFG